MKVFSDSIELPANTSIYCVDVAEADGAFGVLELNPFSGADLYNCGPGPGPSFLDEHLPDSSRQTVRLVPAKSTV